MDKIYNINNWYDVVKLGGINISNKLNNKMKTVKEQKELYLQALIEYSSDKLNLYGFCNYFHKHGIENIEVELPILYKVRPDKNLIGGYWFDIDDKYSRMALLIKAIKECDRQLIEDKSVDRYDHRVITILKKVFNEGLVYAHNNNTFSRIVAFTNFINNEPDIKNLKYVSDTSVESVEENIVNYVRDERKTEGGIKVLLNNKLSNYIAKEYDTEWLYNLIIDIVRYDRSNRNY